MAPCSSDIQVERDRLEIRVRIDGDLRVHFKARDRVDMCLFLRGFTLDTSPAMTVGKERAELKVTWGTGSVCYLFPSDQPLLIGWHKP